VALGPIRSLRNLAGFLLINPKSGRTGPSADELAAAAAERGVEPRILGERDDAARLAAAAPEGPIGIAGGDGSLAPVAAVALERELPFVVVPFGTRNHLARDLGLDRNDPFAALDAFSGTEQRIDVARADDRLFLNNVSFGVYASLVHRREHHRRRRAAFARARALLRTLRHPHRLRLVVDGDTIAARVILVANNAYELRLFDLGERTSLREGRLNLYSAEGVLPTTWDERSGERFTVEAPGHLRAALDGEPTEFSTPIEFTIEPQALRVLLPPRSS
jgi:diacylglycerol kinase family enzyme